MYRVNTCALCGNYGDIRLSHIVPKLVGRNLKKTSIGAIRNTENSNKVVQDIEKHYLLCGKCEELFSESETWFANNIFYPYLKDGKDSFDYDHRLYFFLTSLSWRSLYLDIMDFVENGGIGIDALLCLIDRESNMKNYLLKKKHNISQIENHIFFFDRIEKVSGELGEEFKKLQPHVAIHRGITSYTICYEDIGTYFTITNMMGVIVVTLYKKSLEEQWINTKVDIGNGNIEAKNQKITSAVANEFKNIMRNLEKEKEKLDEKQKLKIKNKILAMGEDIKNYKIFNDIIDDKNIKE
ncbi:hypothetical protein J1C67_01925 [Clostridium gasigenes]|uniref:hypothetical protein n=1 Tax=Clostridium gasigenes TaxID=94869 RepID=UPI0014383086|nr:hypothetical protein [Clostridium gasigenes]NKF08729.1 hypothetical protein [Clostridium gasigenes]QSW19984.1 hypothetical protein J1C67_01925 [Clostridium gasigenes]